MSEVGNISIARSIMKNNFIGPNELKRLNDIPLIIPDNIPQIKFSIETLESKKDDYILIFGAGRLRGEKQVTIKNLIDIFGKNPDIKEPCFYNQDWYEKEAFINKPLNEDWFFIRKNVFDDSRAVAPTELLKNHKFPSAVKCCYSFFIAWLVLRTKLWYHDFVWCSDTDHNGDRIYVGKYHDIDGVNKNGFSIHRHLGLRECYGCID